MFHSNYVSLSLSLFTFIHLFSICATSSQKYSNLPRGEDIPYLANALHDGLSYIKNHNETKTLNSALGIMLVKGSLQWMEHRLKHKFDLSLKFINRIRELLELSKDIFYQIYTIFQIQENSRERKFADLLRHIFDDIAAEDLKYGRLIKKVVQFPVFDNCSFVTSYIQRGTPIDSDFCIIDLFEKSCVRSSSCWFQETNHLENAGYKTSHRLLYLQLLMKLKCDKGYERGIKTMKKTLCQSMLDEAISLYGKNVFFARDLFLEQIALCGFDGYVEFADRDWSIQIPRWQHSSGCFGVLDSEQFPEESCSDWRSDLNGRRDDPCSTHLTAVALPTIAFHLRVAFDQF